MDLKHKKSEPSRQGLQPPFLYPEATWIVHTQILGPSLLGASTQLHCGIQGQVHH